MVARRPNSKRNLDMALRRLGGGDEGYVRRRTAVANAIVASIMPDGAVKGGSALKMRFGEEGTRATTDLDAARSSSLDEFVRSFERRLDEGWEGFEGRLAPRQGGTQQRRTPRSKRRSISIRGSAVPGSSHLKSPAASAGRSRPCATSAQAMIRVRACQG
jgi:hypothetical protein